MEILIPGLILVALMVYASTKIKKRAAAAFEPELIETDAYSIAKPEGFLHVIDDPDHELRAYSKDFGSGDNSKIRQSTIELDVLAASMIDDIVRAIRDVSTNFEIVSRSDDVFVIETRETANEIPLKGFYKLIARGDTVYRLRFSVLVEHADDYSRRIDETLESFTLKHL